MHVLWDIDISDEDLEKHFTGKSREQVEAEIKPILADVIKWGLEELRKRQEAREAKNPDWVQRLIDKGELK